MADVESSEVPFRSAEAWLAARGVGQGRAPRRRERGEVPARGFTEPTWRTLEAAPAEPGRAANPEDRVAAAITYARRATAQTPRSEQRLREALARRGYPKAIIEAALDRCRDDGTVDDRALARALVEEARRRGHAPRRIHVDLHKRGLPAEIVAAALTSVGDRDPEAAAYAVAEARASTLRGVDTQTAYRRLVGYLARRGHEEALARKVARQAVYNDREPQRVAER